MRITVNGVDIEMTVSEAREAGFLNFITVSPDTDANANFNAVASAPSEAVVPPTVPEVVVVAGSKTVAAYTRRTRLEMDTFRAAQARNSEKLVKEIKSASSIRSPLDLLTVKTKYSSAKQFNDTLLSLGDTVSFFFKIPTNAPVHQTHHNCLRVAGQKRNYSYSGYKVKELVDGTTLYHGEFKRMA